jgi:hypothetical protein
MPIESPVIVPPAPGADRRRTVIALVSATLISITIFVLLAIFDVK